MSRNQSAKRRNAALLSSSVIIVLKKLYVFCKLFEDNNISLLNAANG
jgi:hypothetical protein